MLETLKSRKNMKLVTGGLGMIGHHLIKELNEMGHSEIVIVDNLDQDKITNLHGLKYVDFACPQDVFKMDFREFSHVFHLGACSDTQEKNWDYLYQNNYQYSKDIFLKALQFSCNFLYASSAATYGNINSNFDDDESKLDTLKPINLYAMSKHLFDIWLFKNDFLRYATGLKYFNVYGTNEEHKEHMQSFMRTCFRNLMKGSSCSVYDSDLHMMERDFVWVEDAVKATLFLAKRVQSGIFNIGTGEATKWIEVAEACCNAMSVNVNEGVKVIKKDFESGYQYRTKANIQKLKSAGFDLKFTTIDEAAVKYYDFLKKIKEKCKGEADYVS